MDKEGEVGIEKNNCIVEIAKPKFRRQGFLRGRNACYTYFIRHRQAVSQGRQLPSSGSKRKGSTVNINVHRNTEKLSRFKWLLISLGSGTLFILGYRKFQKSQRSDTEPAVASNRSITLYRKMPLKAMSRAWGKFNECDLPISLRKPLLGLYVWMFGVNLREAQDEDLQSYRNLSEFFRRQLKPDARMVDPSSPMTSPSDGKILHFGKCEKGVVEQVKGVNYALKGFLGPATWNKDDMLDASKVSDSQYHDSLGIKPGNSLFHCIIYLAPGDYHRFHSPVDWKINYRRHFPGDLLSVNPGVAKWIQGLFNLNERVVYTGQWEHGFFSYTAVGATNVGSIKIYCDKELSTNTERAHPDTVFYDKDMCECDSGGVQISKGEMMGEFNLGSTIVLLFEAPEKFQFTVQSEQKVLFGEALGHFKEWSH